MYFAKSNLMVINLLTNPVEAEKRSWQMLILGILFASIGVLLSLFIWKDQSSLIMVFITVLAAVPITYNTMKLEERKDEYIEQEPKLLREHIKALSVFMYMFFGVTIAYVLWYFLLPQDLASLLFKQQSITLNIINGKIASLTITGQMSSFKFFTKIFLNNIKVLALCILFSFLYGIGALFILIWNASVLAVAIGGFVSENIANISVVSFFHYIWYSLVSIVKYITHGFFEILAYFIAALAGGIISIGIVQRKFSSKSFERVTFDALELIGIALLILLFAALLEVYVSPLLLSNIP